MGIVVVVVFVAVVVVDVVGVESGLLDADKFFMAFIAFSRLLAASAFLRSFNLVTMVSTTPLEGLPMT